jgi:hypothetical protein
MLLVATCYSWTYRGLNPSEIYCSVQTSPKGPASFLYNVYQVSPGESGHNMALTTHPNLLPLLYLHGML